MAVASGCGAGFWQGAYELSAMTAKISSAKISSAKISSTNIWDRQRAMNIKTSLGKNQCGRAKVKTSLPAQSATYCTPSTEYVMGEALNDWPVLKCHSARPDVASTASTDSESSPTKTTPPAVASV